jgi:aryl-alcohol dehydrogenase-like predicted oxidoreductase
MEISRITLGTAQMGMKYGIANKSKKPNLKTSFEILNFAFSHGINCYDTAQVYGNSEEILGKYFKRKRKKPVIISKLPKIILEKQNPNFEQVYDSIKQSLTISTKKLENKKLSICLLHNSSDLDRYDGLIEKSLIRLKENNLVGKIGISTYTPKEAKRFLENKKLDVIQIPINVLDTRLIKKGILEDLGAENKIIFARSVFLQGILFLNNNKLPKKLIGFSDHIKKINKICIKNNLTVEQLSFLFVRDLKEIKSLVIGVDTISQLKENAKLLSMPILSTNVNEEILKIRNLSDRLLNPSKW